MISDRMDINNVLAEMRSLKSQVQSPATEMDGIQKIEPGQTGVNKTSGFGQLLEQAVDQVNQVHTSASTMATNYEKGVEGVDITDVMIASQKASVSFEAMVQVRNKLVEAYRDVMNMPL